MEKANMDIRRTAESSNVRLWEIAEALNINDGNFSRKLRKELSAEEKSKIIEIIANIVKGREQSA